MGEIKSVPLVIAHDIMQDCEHVSFHRAMMEKNNARHFISSLILFPQAPTQHPRSFKLSDIYF